MKRLGEMLMRKESFSEIVMGNTALVRAMIESGVRVISSYPGSPTPEIADAIKSIPRKERPFYFEFSTNEKVATEVAYGATLNGHLSTVFFKSVGLNVASDTFVQLNHMNLEGGMVIVLGDDPGANSSQNEQDNMHYAYLSYTPVFEPANPEEVYDFFREAAALSKVKKMPVILRLTTHVCHAKEKVTFAGIPPLEFDNTPGFSPDNGPYIPIAAALVFPMKRKALERLEDIRQYAEDLEINRFIDNGNKDKGVITMGLPFLSLLDALEGVSEKPDILKLGLVYPLPSKVIANFLKTHNEVKVLEELDDVVEKEIKAIAFDERVSGTIIGKEDIGDWIGEYTPGKVREILDKNWPGLLPEKKKRTGDSPYIPARPPQMCPGCGHRSAFHAIKKALYKNDITVADIGCHTLGFLPPYKVGEALMCMGASTGIASGLSLFNNERRVIAFLGDSTFFHAGLPGIINCIFNKHNITLIVMENNTTAMTGHQDHAASGRNFNEPTNTIPIRSLLEGLGVSSIFETDTYSQAKLTSMVKEAMDIDGFSVVIAKHPCMLKFTREQQRKPGFKRKWIEIDQAECQLVHECVERFACPTFQIQKDGEIIPNKDLCIGDGSCIQTCPFKAIKTPEANKRG